MNLSKTVEEFIMAVELIVVVAGLIVDVAKVVVVVKLSVDTVVVLMVVEIDVVEEIVVVFNGAEVDVIIATAVEVEAVVVELVMVVELVVVVEPAVFNLAENPEAFSKIFFQKVMFWPKEFCVKKMTQKNKVKNFMTVVNC